MIWLRLAFANLRLAPLTTAVNILLMALGTACIVLLLLAGSQLSQTMSRDAQDIDLVLGAKGSPIQLVLSSVYHADIPPGNISLDEATRWAGDPRVEASIPLSLGDSFRSFRIVGTTTDYASLYGADLADGRLWEEPMEAVVGAAAAKSSGLQTGARFAGSHGLRAGGHKHVGTVYQVVGVLEPTGTVIDRLILTSLDSVWIVHGGVSPFFQMETREIPEREITAMLIQYSTPIAAISLPREINDTAVLQAAAPATEVSRILQIVGIGLDGLTGFAWVLIMAAALSVFAALYGSLRAQRCDLAVLRCLGATRSELLTALLLQGLLLSSLGVAMGLLMGHIAMELFSIWLERVRGVSLTGWTWIAAQGWLILSLFGIGILAAIIPAVQAYRTDAATTLAKG